MRSTGVVSAPRLRLLGAGVTYEGDSKSSAALLVMLVLDIAIKFEFRPTPELELARVLPPLLHLYQRFWPYQGFPQNILHLKNTSGYISFHC
jgi:hypothetical protein